MDGTRREREEKKLQELKTLVREQEERLHNIQTSVFQLANYYFVFQGVILAGLISNTSSLTCSHGWFLFTLSLLAASLNLCALYIMGLKYIDTVEDYELNWSARDKLYKKLEEAIPSSPDNVRDEGNEEPVQIQPSLDQYKVKRRYICLGFATLLFLGFASVMLSGCWWILCKHEDCRIGHHHHHCVKLCDGVKCPRLCYDN